MGFLVWNGADLPGTGLQAGLYCSARGIADGWRNSDSPVRDRGDSWWINISKLRTQNRLEISFQMPYGSRNIRLQCCIYACTLVVSRERTEESPRHLCSCAPRIKLKRDCFREFVLWASHLNVKYRYDPRMILIFYIRLQTYPFRTDIHLWTMGIMKQNEGIWETGAMAAILMILINMAVNREVAQSMSV